MVKQELAKRFVLIRVDSRLPLSLPPGRAALNSRTFVSLARA
jgi:hypothetical protein